MKTTTTIGGAGTSRPPFKLPKLSDAKPKFRIPNFDVPAKKVCRRCEKGLPKNSDRPFADLLCAGCLQVWVEVETVLDAYARCKADSKRAEKLRVWGGLFDGK